jgi:branched-chain amino acid transport system ATP-binding protein
MALFEARQLHKRFGDQVVLQDLSLSFEEGKLSGIMGPNGAGKTTCFNVLTGRHAPDRGTVTFAGEDITRVAAHEIVTRGIALSPEGRRCFPRMTVRENLDLGAYRRRGPAVAADLERVFRLFPRLKERESQKAGTMSGGEQQMLAIGRAMMASPKLLLLDEPSLGIAPILVDRIYQTISEIHVLGVAILLVEQNANRALDAASRGYVLETGRVVLADHTSSLQRDPRVQEAYLGT